MNKIDTNCKKNNKIDNKLPHTTENFTISVLPVK